MIVKHSSLRIISFKPQRRALLIGSIRCICYIRVIRILRPRQLHHKHIQRQVQRHLPGLGIFIHAQQVTINIL